MTVRLVGAGLPRTATHSLKDALQRVLGGPCYHMSEVFEHPEHIPTWHRAVKGEMPDWARFLGGYEAAVDWPASAFWRELAAAFPGAPVILSVREDAETWWESLSQTVWPVIQGGLREGIPGWLDMVQDLSRTRFADPSAGRTELMDAYQRHNDEVRAAGFGERLIEWRAQDGWGPICRALGVPIPDEPFPRTNTRAEWQNQAEAKPATD